MTSLLLRRPHFRRFWLAELVSQLGDWLSYVAVSLLALSHGPGQGALAVALVFVAHALPSALLAPFSGVLADRVDRGRLLAVSHVVAGALTLGMLAAALSDRLLWVEVLLVVRAFASAAAGPARTALTAALVEPDELKTAGALEAATWSAMFAGGMALGGLLASVGVGVALALDALTFVVAAGLALGLPALRIRTPDDGRLRDAVREAVGDTDLLDAVLRKVPLALAGGAAWVVLSLRSEALAFVGTAALTLALLQGVKGLGTGIGPLARRPGLEWVGFAGIGAFLATEQPVVLVLASLAWGIGSGANWVEGQVALQGRSRPEALGRLASLDVLLSVSAQTVAAVTTAVAVELGGPPALAAAPFLLLGLSAAAAAAWRRRPAGRTPRRAGSWSASTSRPASSSR